MVQRPLPTDQHVGAPTGALGGDVHVLVLKLLNRDYAMPLDRVLEVVQMVDIKPIPGTPLWMAGVIDYRGRVVPVLDARVSLDIPRREPELATPIVLASAPSGILGLIVDEVEGLLVVPSPRIAPPDEDAVGSTAVSAIVHHGDRIILMLDVDLLGDRALEIFRRGARSPLRAMERRPA